jgi:Asp-tRNA(Asn)/Glu-tRNA(Gln) amidotransferase B subunit
LIQGAADGGVKEYVESQGLAQISDTSQIGEMLDKIIEAHPKELEQFRSGKTKIKGYFSGYSTPSLLRPNRYRLENFGIVHVV